MLDVREIEKCLPIPINGSITVNEASLKFLEEVGTKLSNEIALCGFCARIGLQHSPDQLANKEKILAFSSNDLSVRVALTQIQADIGKYKIFLTPASAIRVFSLVYPILAYVLSAEEREVFPRLTAFCREFGDVIDNDGKYSHFLADERIGCQIDCAPKPHQVRQLAEDAIELNKGFKKKESQRQKEKASKKQSSPNDKSGTTGKEKVIKTMDLSPVEFREYLWSWLETRGYKPVAEDITVLPGFDPSARPEGHSTHNLLVKGKKTSTIYLISMLQATKANLKELAKKLKEKELRFVDINASKYADLLCQKEGCLTMLSLAGNKVGRVKSVISKNLNDLPDEHVLRICAGCKDPLDHSQHNIVDIPWEDVQQQLRESNTDEPIVLEF